MESRAYWTHFSAFMGVTAFTFVTGRTAETSRVCKKCFDIEYNDSLDWTNAYKGNVGLINTDDKGEVTKPVYTLRTINVHTTTYEEWEKRQLVTIFTKRCSQPATQACQFEPKSIAWPVIMVNLYVIPSQNSDCNLCGSCMSAECSYSFNIQEDRALSCVGYVVETHRWRRASRQINIKIPQDQSSKKCNSNLSLRRKIEGGIYLKHTVGRDTQEVPVRPRWGKYPTTISGKNNTQILICAQRYGNISYP